MTGHDHRYADGRLKRSQDEADRRYRDKQRRLREWADTLADQLNLTREQLVRLTGPDLGQRILETYR